MHTIHPAAFARKLVPPALAPAPAPTPASQHERIYHSARVSDDMGHLLFPVNLPSHVQAFLAEKIKMYVVTEYKKFPGDKYTYRFHYLAAPGLQHQWTYFHPNGRDVLRVDYSDLCKRRT